MSLNGGKGNSFWRPRDSSKDKQPAPSGSAQLSSSSASGGGGWGRQSSSNPLASGGRWGRPPGSFDHPAAVCGGLGRPNFAVVLIAALLLLPGVTQVIADEFTQGYIQKNQIVTPYTHDDIDRAIEAFNRQHPQKAPAPPEEYTCNFVMHAFKKNFVLSQDDLPALDDVCTTYIATNPLRYGQPLKAALERALFKIHEELQTKLRKTIPEKDSHPPALTMCQEFTLKLTTTLSSYRHSSPEDVKKFVAEYMRKPLSDHLIPGSFDKDTGRPICLRDSQAYTDQHMSHAVHTYFMTLDLRSIVRDRFGFVDNKMPSQLFRQLPSFVRNLIRSAICDNGRVVNCFLMVFPHGMQYDTLKKKLLKSLITPTQQSNSFHIVSLTMNDRPTTGDICLVIPDKIYTQTKSEKDSANDRVMTRKPGMSSYKTQGPKGCILLGTGEILDWKLHSIQCSFNGANMQLPMEQFCTILRSNSGAIPLFIEDEQLTTFSKELPEHDQFSIHDDTSSAGGGWGAAAPK